MTGYNVDISAILDMAKQCYAAANGYAAVVGRVSDVDAAVGHLTDKDGAATAADTEVIALVDEFVEYLKTTSSRYFLAGEQLEASASTYTQQEEDQRRVFEAYMGDLESGDSAYAANREYGNADWNPGDEADETARQEGTTEHADGFGTEQHAASGSAEDYLDTVDSGRD
ncbi:hypothetical protein [Actinophytocola glycyrrhizae]|uniref:Excreted virulence factor EspC (Type VII ESX diderm) n=1 Tax=Actinophytocola glycyrrhizae TaxID=2044873 RepID=A0ABV9RX07_9PSEU